MATAQNVRTPTADVVIDGERVDISNLFTVVNGLYVIPSTTVVAPISGLSVIVGSTGNPDPVIAYSFSATNFLTGPVPFAFDEAIPLTVPCPRGSVITASVGYSLTAGGDTAPTLTPFGRPTSQEATGDGNDLGVNVGAAFTGVGGGTTTTSFNGSGLAPFGFSVLDVHLAFTLTGGGDNAGITGRVSCSPAPVPEPGTISLLAGIGLSGTAFAFRARRRISRSA